jgi:hypothetical protein
MMIFAIGIELANVVAVQRLHDADPREHRRTDVAVAASFTLESVCRTARGFRAVNSCAASRY